MITDGIEQRSISWFRSRVGFLTGSKIADIMKSGRKKDEIFSETAKAYLFQVAGERLFNPTFLNDDDIFQDYIDQVSVNTKAMQWGADQEDAAKSLFMQMNFPEGEIVELSSCKHDTIPYFAASPDGAIYGRDGEDLKIIEVKCPNINTYMKYRTLIHDAASLKETEPKYYWQMMAEMSCTRRWNQNTSVTSPGYFKASLPLLKSMYAIIPTAFSSVSPTSRWPSISWSASS